MKIGTVFLASVLLAVAAAQQQQPAPNGLIYGVVIAQDGQPAKRVVLAAMPLGVPIDGALPHTKTNDRGEYLFSNLPWWGRYAVYGDDEEAGYVLYSTALAGDSHPSAVEVTPEHRKAEFNFSLPSKAGFIQIRLTNRRNGAAISAMSISVVPMEKPDARLFKDAGVFTMSCHSDHVILVPPDENLLLHVKSDGFREWDESFGKGKPINVPSGARLNAESPTRPLELIVQLLAIRW